MDRWIRHLKEPSIPSLAMMKGQIHADDPTVTEKQLEDIARSVKTRVHSRRPDLICAIKQNGGCTKAFPDLKQLSRWIAENYVHDWQYELMLVPSAGLKPQRILVYCVIICTIIAYFINIDKKNKYFELKNSWGADGAPQT